MAIPAGGYRIGADDDDRIRAAANAPARADGGHAHPIFAFIAGLGGMGVSVAELCRRLGASIDDGPVLARCTIDQARPMEVDRDYRITGEVREVVRKPSRRFGAADHVTLALAVASADRHFAELTLVWVMPRPAGEA